MRRLKTSMTSLKSILTTGILGGSLLIGGCGDNKKYQDFANFVIKEGKMGSLRFSKENKKYACGIYLNKILISVSYGKSKELFLDENFNGLDYYSFRFDDGSLIQGRSFWLSKEDEDKYDSLIDSLPKLYAESKTQVN